MRGRKVLGILTLLAVTATIAPAGASAWRVQGAANLFRFEGIPRQPGSFMVRKCGGPRTGLYSLGVFNLKLDRALDRREASIVRLRVDLPVTGRFRPGVIGASWLNFHEYLFNRNEEHNIAFRVRGFFARLESRLSRNRSMLVIRHPALKFGPHQPPLLKAGYSRIRLSPASGCERDPLAMD